MMKYLSKLWFPAIIYFMICVTSSIIKSAPNIGNCGKKYPIDYIIYSNLFCEIKGD